MAPAKFILPHPTTVALAAVRGSAVVESLFSVASIVCGLFCWALFCYAVISVISSFAIISLREREREREKERERDRERKGRDRAREIWLLFFNCLPVVMWLNG